MFLQGNLKYNTFTSLLLANPTALYKEVLQPYFTCEQTPGRQTGQINFTSGIHGQSQQYEFGPPSPIWCLSSNSWGCKIYLIFASFLMSARALWTYCESLTSLSEVFSPGKITWVTVCAVNYTTHHSPLILFIIFYSTIQRKTKLNSATSPHTSIHLQSMFLISRHKCGTTEL